jgi:sensor histidine kinase YesM
LLEVQLSRTQLEVLRAQLQPHFLFNTLHSIAALMHEDVGGADRMIARLSDLLRMTLENGAVQEVALKSELEFLDGYLDIEKTRFQDRLMVEEQIAPEALDCGVPNMILQPIVENAIRHGIARKSSPGKIEIRAAKSDGWLALTISDDGPGADATQVAGGKGRGLANTRARLKCLYGEKQRFVTKQRPGGGMEVEMLIPAKLMQDEAPGTLTKTWIARPTPP